MPLRDFVGDAPTRTPDAWSSLPPPLQGHVGTFLTAKDTIRLGITSWDGLEALRAEPAMERVLQAQAADAWATRRAARYQQANDRFVAGREALERASAHMESMALANVGTSALSQFCFRFTVCVRLSRSQRVLMPQYEQLSTQAHTLNWNMFHRKPAFGPSYRANLEKEAAIHDDPRLSHRQVATLQAWLEQQGHDVPQDGVLGQSTHEAVNKMLMGRTLPAVQRVTQRTLATLVGDEAAARHADEWASACAEQPAAPGEQHARVDRARELEQILQAYAAS